MEGTEEVFGFFKRFIYLHDREHAPVHTSWWGGEGQRERDSAANSPLSAEPYAGLDPTTPSS